MAIIVCRVVDASTTQRKSLVEEEVNGRDCVGRSLSILELLNTHIVKYDSCGAVLRGVSNIANTKGAVTLAAFVGGFNGMKVEQEWCHPSD